jgi:hypothetical protein
LWPDHFAHQHGAGRPFATKAEAEQGARDQELIEVLHDRTEQ